MSKDLPALVEALPPHLAERARVLGELPISPRAEFVVYWMRTAVRAHENPALDSALVLASKLGLPAFVYHALSERYRYASDRHHTFILEGARDVERELAERGIGHAFHLERPGHRGRYLEKLARSAAVVVTEDFPVEPLRSWTKTLATLAPVVAVDTACLVPMQSIGRAYERAFAFRRATEAARAERLERSWEEAEPPGPAFLPELPFEPLVLADAEIPELVAPCEIDHSVAPVPHTRGGSRAGYARWRRFRDRRLKRYARDRNDALRDGVSRLSPYLHYGMVSPLRIAREAADRPSKGSEKFLDELLVWRELSHVWCFYRREHQGLGALPGWARRSLEDHAADPRPGVLSWETLARARSVDRLWDAAQRSLLIHGELHNNVRMTWGKAIPFWTADPARALEILIDLNHRYALDGRDPNSYAGLLWCLGLFDRPFKPEKEILGVVRPRSTSGHARRLDVESYAMHTGRPALAEPPRVAVVGGGIAGLACARALADHGLSPVIFDKGRGPGGRASTRRVELGGEELTFDHGAQYFTARDPRFERHLRSWRQDGVVASWEGRIAVLERGELSEARGEAERWVGRPGMNAVVAHLGRDLDVLYGARVEGIAAEGALWKLSLKEREAEVFDAVALTVPAPQAMALLETGSELYEPLAKVEMLPCWAAMVAFDDDLDTVFDGAFVEGSPLAWVARNSSKSGRASRESWVLHAGDEWSHEHLEIPKDEAAEALLAAFAEALGLELPPPCHLTAHRWLYARPAKALGVDCLLAPGARLGYAGDACRGGRIEDAFLSGLALAGRFLGEWGAAESPPRETEGEQLELFS